MNLASRKTPVADRPRLRALLRFPGRGDEPVVSRPRLRQPPGRAAALARGGLSLHRRHHRQGALVHPRREGDRSRQAVPPLLLPGRLPRTPPRARRSGPTSTRASSTWATRPTASRCSRARSRWASCPRRPSCRRSTRTSTRRAPTGRRAGPSSTPCRPWDSLSDDEKRLFCRMAEVYAGFLSHADHQIGRLLDHLEESGRARQHADRARLRQRRVRRGRPERLGEREQDLQRAPRPDRGEPSLRRRCSAARRPTTTIRPAGRARSTRRSSSGSATRTGRAGRRTR